jgi:hypothetical protein
MSQHSKALSHFGRFTSAMDSVSAIPFWARLYTILRAGAILNATELHQCVESLASMYKACTMQLKSRTRLMIAAPTICYSHSPAVRGSFRRRCNSVSWLIV